MARSVPWRRTCNDLVCWRQCQAMEATIYILRETGPTGFLLKDEGETKPVKVFLGDPHNCTCSQFAKDRDLCKHICWLILKKFRVPQNNPISWQKGLVEREINDMLFGSTVKQRKTPMRRWKTSGPPGTTGFSEDGRPCIQQREIGDDDVCPICQDELLIKHLPVTFCKFGCGNSIHIKCMKIWADHQKTSGETTVKCPFCREDFGPFELLKQESRNAVGVPSGGRMDRHLSTSCQSCHASPIEGKCYRCSVCVDYHLCQQCFNTPLHTNHPFEYRHKRNQRWRPAQRTYGAVVPEAVANDLMNRDITESDYELLMQLDSNAGNPQSLIPEEVVLQFPLERVREGGPLLAPGKQCRVCLRAFELGQFVRKLPRCKHKFHRDCIDNWLIHSHPTCPIDGQTVWDPISAQAESEEQSSQRVANSRNSDPGRNANNERSSLVVPGVGIIQTHEINNAERAVNNTRGRRVTQPGRLQTRLNEEVVPSADSLRSSFTLNGVSVNQASGDVSSEPVAAPVSLPGSRLLGRTQTRRATLSQQLADLQIQPASSSVENPEDLYIESHSGQKLHKRQSRKDRSCPRNSDMSTNSSKSEASSQRDTRAELPLGHRSDVSTMHQTILNTLSLLQNCEENRESATSPDSAPSNPSSRASSRSLSVRNTLLSRTSEIHSPVRELPPLIESEMENNPNVTDSELDAMSSITSAAASSIHQRLFQRAPRLELPADITDSNPLTLTSVRSTTDSQSLNGSQLSLSSLRSAGLANGVIVSNSPNIGLTVRSENQGGSLPPRGPRSSDRGRVKRAGRPERHAPRQGSGNRQQEPPVGNEQLIERLQYFTDLYLGNDPRGAIQGNSTKPPKGQKKQLSNPDAARQRRREMERNRRKNNDFALEGNALNNLMLRDIL